MYIVLQNIFNFSAENFISNSLENENNQFVKAKKYCDKYNIK